VQIASGSFANGLRLFLAPVDPLASRGARATRPASTARAGVGNVAGPPSPTSAGNAFERGVLNGQLAGPAKPTVAFTRPLTPATPRGTTP
jgi:hypothetical protein